MAKPFNPFEHHHHHEGDDHDHDHHHAQQPLDPAQQSLADSLKVSFFILKLVMVVMVVLYLVSGIFYVKTGEVAIVLRFGQIVGATDQDKTVQSGKLHFALPFPIDQVIRIPVNDRQFELMEEFWYTKSRTQSEDEAAAGAGSLNPEQQGSLITGDANIVHARWRVKYKVIDPVAFAQTLANARITDSEQMMDEAEQVVRLAAQEGIVFAVAQVPADDMIKKQTAQVSIAAKAHMQTTLDKLKSGIEVRELAASETAMPLSVRAAYQMVITAENERADAKAKAEKTQKEILGGAAGDAHEALFALVKRYEIAVDSGNRDEVARLDAAFTKAFAEMKVEGADGRTVDISGEVASAISEAQAFQNQIATTARREAETFTKLKEHYDANPAIFLNRQWEAVRERIFSNKEVETFYLPPSQMELLLTRDPKLAKQKEIDRQKAAQERQNAPRR